MRAMNAGWGTQGKNNQENSLLSVDIISHFLELYTSTEELTRTWALQCGGRAHSAARRCHGGGGDPCCGRCKADAGADARPDERRGPADVVDQPRSRLFCPPNLPLCTGLQVPALLTRAHYSPLELRFFTYGRNSTWWTTNPGVSMC